MAEEWLEEIYEKAYLIQEFHEVVQYLNIENNRNARAIYNKSASRLEMIISDLAQADMDAANRLQNSAICVSEVWDDPCEASARIESVLIPQMFIYMQNFTGISVEEGKYHLLSSDSGFLTVKDLESGKYLHNLHDPMHEAWHKASHIYDPGMESFRLFGCGLGYLPYMLWKKSGGAMDIYVYEDESEILDYAVHFGVLSWIDHKCLHMITAASRDELSRQFLKDSLNAPHPEGRYISSEKMDPKNPYYAHLNRMKLGDTSKRELHDISVINLWKNSTLGSSDIKSLYGAKPGNEWIVVAAGPSLDNNLEFIRKNSASCNVIAVNTVLKRLQKEGIRPDLFAVADPYPQICEHLKGSEDYTADIPLIADKVANWEYCRLYKGTKCFVPTTACSFIPGALSEGEDLWDVEGTVSCLAIEVAIRHSAASIHLIGLDLAYPGGINYAEGMPHTRNTQTSYSMQVLSNDGSMVGTTEVFEIFKNAVEDQIALHKGIRFINHSAHGALIKGTEKYNPHTNTSQ